ncbi:phage tail assembly chaperone [Acuticoccus sp. M5D2P5]|uniref:phage tail assembly chaperone n=1 Tax=Acuticoccus kalidii TaxID=2910977 RepID=UPI001F45EEBC|nr:phage tail assembly chaperone [Acuticoccus kalidii]MCF3934456.1 phage tail assembly chaperone [Acuticoccus kalidii]
MSAAPQQARPFPWRDLMALFLGERRMAPRDFWALSLPEILAVLGVANGASGSTRRSDLARLMEAFPDGG